MKTDYPTSSTSREVIADILASVLIRHFTVESKESGEEKTGIPPERMPNTHGHNNWRTS